ncbi:MAG TPA: response regulator, partial [Bacteroidales bacterium]|nr:response regulator [Bacteroidales bacterium]
GIGIPADKIEEVFNRFYSESYGMDDMAGTGIGLSFSQNLIALHKGKITVQSEPGVETIFMVSIPVSKQAYSDTDLLVEAGDQQVTSENARELISNTSNELIETIKKERKNISLLIVEDNTELRKFLVNHFSGYRVLEAGDGVEALAKARQSIPDIILSDVMMPRMDGVQLCNEIKSDIITSHIPVILLTAKTAIEHKIEGYEHGADAYIEKPFDINLVDSLLRNLLKQRELLRKRFATREDIEPSEISTGKCDRDFFEKAEKLVGENISNLNFSVEDFSALLNMSRSQLFRKFKAVLDITPSEFIRLERVKAAKKLLDEAKYNVNEISIETGFSSPSHFISTFKKATGFTPREYQQR